MKQVALCIRCQGGVFINVRMEEAAANAFVKGWLEGSLPLSKDGCVGGQAPPEIPLWAVRVDEIVLVHTQPLQPEAMQAGGPPWFGPRASGN